ncbi:MAG TPA: cytochrome c [Stellaceae bacterium]|nr:cytochrome c [Stellaceae bacterium]
MVGLAVVGGLIFIYSGAFNVAATVPHTRPALWILHKTRDRSIKVHAAGITPPPGLNDKAKVVMGAEHFATHCAVCHGAPGVPRGEIGEGLYPQPPNLAHGAMHHTPGELFWILKHGIKMTGMPSWADHSDDELWALVAFLEKLPGTTKQEYAKLVAEGRAQYPHHPEGNGMEPSMGMMHAPAGSNRDRTDRY